MKITLWMSTSLNGMIARKGNKEDFISWKSGQLWIDYINKAGCLILGRKAYEHLTTWPSKYINKIKGVTIVVVSTDKNYKVIAGFNPVQSPKDAVTFLKEKGFNEIVVTGGSTLNSSFAEEGLVDEVILNIEPNVIGEGIPLFVPKAFDLKLEFLQMTKTEAKTVQLHYKVIN